MSLVDNIRAYYKLDEASGNAADATGYGNTLVNTGSVTYGTGKINNGAIGTNTTGGYLKVASDLGFRAASDMTWNFWLKPNSLTGYLLDNITNSTDAARLIIYGSTTTIHMFIDTNEVVSSTLTPGTWYMVTVTKTGSTYELFINTVSQGTTTPGVATYNGGVGFTILNGLYTGGTNTNDTMDEVGVWSRALSSGERTALYNGGAGLQYPFGLNVLVANPATGSGGTTMDGFDANGYASTWASVRSTVQGDGIGNTWTPSGTFLQIRALRNGSGYYCTRIGMSFDTSSIPDNATITGVQLSVYGQTANFVNANSTSVVPTLFTPAAPGTYVAADWTQVSYTVAASAINLSAVNQIGYNDFALNSTGIAAVSLTGVTSFALITGLDQSNTGPTSSGNDNIFCVNSTDFGSGKPTLQVTYTLPLGPSGVKTFDGLNAQ